MSRSLSDLVKAGLIRLWLAELGPRRQAHRRLYVSSEIDEWIAGLSDQDSGQRLQSERSEIEAIFAHFISGQPLTYFYEVNPPAGEGIKKIKTARFRLWGWAHEPQTLVLVVAATKASLVATRGLERDLGRSALEKRKALGVHDAASGHWSELFPKAG